MQPTEIPLSLYIHLPWCLKKCPYCDFNSHTLKTSVLPEEKYISQLIKDFETDLIKISGRTLSSIFIGGGTPSLFSGKALAHLLREIKSRLPYSNQIETTMEVNPGAVEHDRFEAYLEAGINRLSIGAQSFSPMHLKLLGRIHQSDQISTAVLAAQSAGFTNINIDLMFGLPQQSEAQGLADLEQAIDLNPSHLSWYQLTLEPNTVFYKTPPTLPHEEIIESLQIKGLNYLQSAGFEPYEVSAFSRPGYQCRHNLNYWQFGDYLGIGAGAHGKLTLADNRIIRLAKTRMPETYLQCQSSFIIEERTLNQRDKIFEFMLNHLRLKNTIEFSLFEKHTGVKPALLRPYIEKGLTKGIFSLTLGGFKLSEMGERFLNDCTALFLD